MIAAPVKYANKEGVNQFILYASGVCASKYVQQESANSKSFLLPHIVFRYILKYNHCSLIAAEIRKFNEAKI